jgi:hypothetical protein
MSYPTNKQTFAQTQASDKTDAIDHNGIHNNLATTVNALQDKVGITSDTNNASHDYKLSEVTSTDKAVGKSATQTLTNKTLTSPTLTTPVISDFTSATHDHSANNKGGQLNASTCFESGTVPAARLGSGTASSTTYLAGNNTWQSIATGSTAISAIGQPEMGATGITAQSLATNTTMFLGLATFQSTVTVSKITMAVLSYVSSGTAKVGIYSNDGATLIASGTTGTITADGPYTITLGSPVTISAGKYYIGVVGVSGNFQAVCYTDLSTVYTYFNSVTSEPRISGSLTVTAGTLPSTITPTSITAATSATPVIRLDN